MTDEQYEQGMRARREVLGDKHVDRAIERTTPLTEPFQDGLSNAEIREVLLHSAVYARGACGQRRIRDRAARTRGVRRV